MIIRRPEVTPFAGVWIAAVPRGASLWNATRRSSARTLERTFDEEE
jgi:hypothetical protein